MNLIDGKILNYQDFINSMNQKSFQYKEILDHQNLFSTLSKIKIEIDTKKEIYHALKKELISRGDVQVTDADEILRGLSDFIETDHLREKLKREFGTEFPFELKRINYKTDCFESFYPLGILLHVTPNNSPLLSVLGLIEGLLSGNINLLKLGRKETAFASIFFKRLIELDSSQKLKDYIVIGQIPSKDKENLKNFFHHADVASVWGSEESVRSIKELLPTHTRVVEWGHKISFLYISQKNINEADFEKIAFEICNLDQQACSSPQCLFLEESNFDELVTFSEKLKIALKKVSKTIPKLNPSIPELAELMVTSELVRLEESFSKAKLIEEKGEFRIFVSDKSGLEASPLYRTIWVKPIKRSEMQQTLRPLRKYLQTVGLFAVKDNIDELTFALLNSGVQRIRPLGEMTDSYTGEPHDGEYALLRFCQKISFKDSGDLKLLKGRNSFEKKITPLIPDVPIMTKNDFQNLKVEESKSDLFFHSGGSSGEPKLSIFSYVDYHRQMELAAEGLFAAGLDPKTDRCMNLFYAGNLYGGFISFFTILEKMEAIQFPMGASTEFTQVGETIVKNEVDTILGMPSYILQLFAKNESLFIKNPTIKKIFYGGEHLSKAQMDYLKNTFKVELIKSATYGSVDAGPLGFQCEHIFGGVHHLHERLHDLEIIDLEKDQKAKEGAVGRLIFTSKMRHGQKIERYEIGDVGRLIPGACECGRKGVRFELMGRTGDVFRIGSIFFSYQKFQKLLMDQFDYKGNLQLHLHAGDGKQKDYIELWIEKNLEQENLLDFFIKEYAEVNEVVKKDCVMDLKIKYITSTDFVFNKNTGKLKSVIDHRH